MFSDLGQPLQPIDVVGLRVFAFTEHNNGAEFGAAAGGTFEGLRLAAAFSHRRSADQPKRSEKFCLVYLGQRAEAAMQIGVLQVL